MILIILVTLGITLIALGILVRLLTHDILEHRIEDIEARLANYRAISESIVRDELRNTLDELNKDINKNVK